MELSAPARRETWPCEYPRFSPLRTPVAVVTDGLGAEWHLSAYICAVVASSGSHTWNTNGESV